MAYVVINKERCKACLLCTEFCPRQCLGVDAQMNSRGFHSAALLHPEKCTGCRICALMCPDVCIDVYREAKAEPVGGTAKA